MNECDECYRMDCRDRGCIAPTSVPNTNVIVADYKKRPRMKIVKSRDLDPYGGPYTLDDLSELKNGGALNIDRYYDEVYVTISWEQDETDEEYTERMIKLDKVEERLKRNAIKNAAKKQAENAEKTLLNSAMSKLSKEEFEALKRNLNR